MAPSRPRGHAEDSKTETANGKNNHHTNGGHHPATNGKPRRTGGHSNAATSAAATAAAAAAAAAAAQQQQQANGTGVNGAEGANAPTIPWLDFGRNVLHAYRRIHHIDSPSCFSNDFHHWILTQPGSIGRHSSSMRRRKEIRRQSKLQLANTMRKHSNSLGVQENDIIVDFLHKVQTHEVVRLHRLRRNGSNWRELDG